MLAAPINPSDINSIEGVYPNKPTVPGAVGGIEGVGQVQAVGPAVTASLSPGDWVIAFPHTAMGSFSVFPRRALSLWSYSFSPSSLPLLRAGTWQTYAVKPQELWHKVRNDVPMEYAATVTVNPLSALVLLQCFTKLNPGACPLPTCHPSTSLYISKKLYMLIPSKLLISLGDTIVQNGATSIVGQCLIQLAKAQGIRTINIIRDRYHIQIYPCFCFMLMASCHLTKSLQARVRTSQTQTYTAWCTSGVHRKPATCKECQEFTGTASALPPSFSMLNYTRKYHLFNHVLMLVQFCSTLILGYITRASVGI
jgi:hypothetical protein